MPAPRHARPPRRRPLAVATAVALGAAAVAVPLAAQASPGALRAPVEPAGDDAHVLHVALARLPAVRHPALPATVTVRPGDTLWALAGRVCGNPRDDLALAYNNGIANPDLVFAGQVLRAACQAAAAALAAKYPPPPPARVTSAASQPPPRLAAEVTSSGYFGCSALEALWDGAGGNPASAFTAAEVAMAESGGNPDAISPTDDRGLWQVNASHGPEMATLNPYGNARAAVAISDDGTNWSAWTTYRDGLETGRC